jgi:hypothetical protein
MPAMPRPATPCIETGRSARLAACLAACLLSLALSACHARPRMAAAPRGQNVVAAYLAQADRQYETNAQRGEIERALEDMLTQPPEVLRNRRYADYGGTDYNWTAPLLIQRYFVPAQPVPGWNEKNFYRDVSAPAARAAIRAQLEAMHKGGMR